LSLGFVEWRHNWTTKDHTAGMVALAQAAKVDSDQKLAEALAVNTQANAVFSQMCTHAAISHMRVTLHATSYAHKFRAVHSWLLNYKTSSHAPHSQCLAAFEEMHAEVNEQPEFSAVYVDALRQDFLESAILLEQLQESRVHLVSRYLRLLLRVKNIVPMAKAFIALQSRWLAKIGAGSSGVEESRWLDNQTSRRTRVSSAAAARRHWQTTGRMSSASQTERVVSPEVTVPRPWTAGSMSPDEAAWKLDQILANQEELKSVVELQKLPYTLERLWPSTSMSIYGNNCLITSILLPYTLESVPQGGRKSLKGSSSRGLSPLPVNSAAAKPRPPLVSLEQESDAAREFQRDMDAVLAVASFTKAETDAKRETRMYEELVFARNKSAFRLLDNILGQTRLRHGFSQLALGFLEYLKEQIEREVVDQWGFVTAGHPAATAEAAV